MESFANYFIYQVGNLSCKGNWTNFLCAGNKYNILVKRETKHYEVVFFRMMVSDRTIKLISPTSHGNFKYAFHEMGIIPSFQARLNEFVMYYLM